MSSKYGNLSSFPSHSFNYLEKLEYQGIANFVGDYGKIYPNLVKEFYENLNIVFGDDFENLENVVLYTSIRKKNVRMNLETFGNGLGLPTSGQILLAGYTPNWKGYSKVDSFLRMIRPSQRAIVARKNSVVNKFNMFGSSFSVNYRMLNFIIAYVLLPKHSKHSRVNELELQVLYGIKHDIKISWAFTILNCMCRVHQLSGGFPYGRLITHILKVAGVNMRKHPYVTMTAKDFEINDKTTRKNTGIVLAMDETFIYKDDFPTNAPVAPPATAPNQIPEGGVTMDLLFSKLCSIETTMTNNHKAQQAKNAFFWKQMKKLLSFHNQEEEAEEEDDEEKDEDETEEDEDEDENNDDDDGDDDNMDE